MGLKWRPSRCHGLPVGTDPSTIPIETRGRDAISEGGSITPATIVERKSGPHLLRIPRGADDGKVGEGRMSWGANPTLSRLSP